MSYRGALWLEREDRYYEERPDLVLQAMALEPGDVVADIGTGSGYYARQIAPLVAPGGRVLAVDIQPQMLKFLSQLVEEEGVTRVEPILSEPDDPKLPAGEVDWILLADVYHEIAAPERVLSKMREALAPDGRVALLEYRVEDGTGDRVKADHTMSPSSSLGMEAGRVRSRCAQRISPDAASVRLRCRGRRAHDRRRRLSRRSRRGRSRGGDRELGRAPHPPEDGAAHSGDAAGRYLSRGAGRQEKPVLSKNTNELKSRVSRGVSDRRAYAYFAKGS